MIERVKNRMKNSLPYNTGPENLEKLVNVLGKRNGYSIEESEARSIYDGSMFNPTRRAAIELGIIEKEENSLRLTDAGKNYLLKGEEILEKCVLNYKPYRLVLENTVNSGNDTIEKGKVKSIFAQQFEVSDRVQEGAALFFLKLIDYIEWGTYKIGRKRETRVELNVELSEILSEDKTEDENEVDETEDEDVDFNREGPDETFEVVINSPRLEQRIKIEDKHDWDFIKETINSVEKLWKQSRGGED